MKIIAMLVLLFLTSFSKKYKYIELVEDHRASESKALKYRAAKIIDADSDSAAYCKAFLNFCISKRSNIEVEKKLGKPTINPGDFTLYNHLEEYIKNKVSFVGKQQREREIMEVISSLKIPKK